MKNITLISDWQMQDPYLAMFKGQLLSRIPEATLFDLTHNIEVMHVNTVSFLLKNCYQRFEVGTVHIDLVGATDFYENQPMLAVKDGHFFISPATEVLSLMFFSKEEPLTIYQYTGTENGFWAKMIALAESCLAGTWETCTEVYSDYRIKRPFEANHYESQRRISGHVMYIDAQNNVLTNIPVEMFQNAVRGGKIDARVGSNHITHYHDRYVRDEEPYFIPNSLGMMEVTVYGGRVSLLAHWQRDTDVEIDYTPGKQDEVENK